MAQGQQAQMSAQEMQQKTEELQMINQYIGKAQELYDAKRYNAAARYCHRILSIRPNGPKALHLLGLIFHQKSKHQAGLEMIDMALEQKPEELQFWFSKGLVQMAMYEPLEARATYFKVLEMAKKQGVDDLQLAKIYSNLANTHLVTGDYNDAIDLYEQALTLDADHDNAKWNKSHAFLVQGDFENGWPGYEARLEMKKSKRKAPFKDNAQMWQGQEYDGKTLLVHDEQGLGDIIQYARFLTLAKELSGENGKLVFEVKPDLVTLLADFPGVDEFVVRESGKDPDVEYDYYVALMSLPYRLGINSLEDIPAETPYFTAKENKLEEWKPKVEEVCTRPGPKVGLVWAGKYSIYITLRHRAYKLKEFVPYVKDIAGINWVGLQKGEESKQLEDIPDDFQVHNFGDDFVDFTDTAAVIDQLDLVITMDTAVAHLAGSMNKPVWLMLSYPPDWRWLLEGEEYPWYPSMRIFRGTLDGGWEPIFEKTAQELTKFVKEFGA